MGCGFFSPRPSATIRQKTHGWTVTFFFNFSCSTCRSAQQSHAACRRFDRPKMGARLSLSRNDFRTRVAAGP